jgi:signal transduction histidine kinase
MPTHLRTRLTLTTLAVLLIGMGLAAILSWLAVEQLFIDTQRENLLAQARITAAALKGQPLSASAEPYSQTMNALPGIHTHLLDEQNAVVLAIPPGQDAASLRVPLLESSRISAPDSLYSRPEIDSALQGIPATSVRRVQGRGVLYAAAPIYAADGTTITGIVYIAMPLPANVLPAGFILQVIAALAAAILLALLAGTLLSRRIARPLEQVARAAQAVAAGDLEQQVPSGGNIREMQSLGESFNRMTASLRQSATAKNVFIADVTHELRTPLTVIKGTIETLEDGALDDARGRGPLLESMQRETERLIRMVNELLVLTRADAGVLQMDNKPVDLAELARTRCEGLRRLADPRGVGLAVEARDQAVAQGDPDRIAQILDNLLDNAIRHSPEKTTVTVSIRKSGNEIQCAVGDQGEGIAAKHLPLIFERFYRADASRNRQTGGTGLGLAIVRALVTAQGGRVAAESAEGRGTTISFWLPKV